MKYNNNILICIICILIIIVIIGIIYSIITKQKYNEPFEYHVYFINRNSDKDRLKTITDSAKQNNIKLNRVEAIDNKTHVLSNKEQRLVGNNKLTNGERCCALSHYYTWKQMIDENINHMLICEDDCILNKNFKGIVNYEVKNINKPFDLLYLYHIGNPSYHGEWVMQGAICYMVSLNGAKKLVNLLENNGMKMPIDIVMIESPLNIKYSVLTEKAVKLSDVPTTIVGRTYIY